jgi:hypothetical protein
MGTWKKIEKQIEKYARRTCSAAAGKVRDELYKTAQTVISDFYNHYDPKYYRRHYWNFEENSFTKYYDDHGGKSVIYGGIKLTPQSLKNIYEEKNTQEVFDSVFAGFHGVASMFYTPKKFSTIPPRMIPSPRQLLLDKQREIIENQDEYIAYGKSVASRECPMFIK